MTIKVGDWMMHHGRRVLVWGKRWADYDNRYMLDIKDGELKAGELFSYSCPADECQLCEERDMSDKMLAERLGCLFDLPDWVELLHRLDVLWAEHGKAGRLRERINTLTADNAALRAKNDALIVENERLRGLEEDEADI